VDFPFKVMTNLFTGIFCKKFISNFLIITLAETFDFFPEHKIFVL